MKRIIFIFLLAPFFLTAQDYSDTMYIAREADQLYLYQYRTFEDGRQEGLISGAFRVPIDSAQAAQYVAAQIFQVANDYWAAETRRINAGTFMRKVAELDSLSLREFGNSARNITRDAAKPDLLTYKAETGQDTAFMWRWRLLKTGAAGIDAQIVERFSTRVLRIIPAGGSEIVLTADNVNVLRFSYEGATRIFLRNPANPNEWVSYDANKGINYRLVRRVNARASAEFKAQNAEK